MLRHSLLVCTCFLSRPSFYVATQLFVFSSSLCLDPVLLCREKTSLHCVGIFVTRWKSLSRPCLYVFSLFLCRDLNISVAASKLLFSLKYVATLNSFVVIKSVHYISFTCCDFLSLSGPETLSFSIVTFITLSRQNFFIPFSNMTSKLQ